MTQPLDVEEFLSGYFAEAEEHLGLANKNLLSIEESLKRGETNPRAVRELFRSLHTVKGISAMVGVEPVVDLAHVMETVLRSADRAGGKLPTPAVGLLLKGVRAIEDRVQDLARKKPVRAAPDALVDALASLQLPAAGDAAPAAAQLDLPPEIRAKLNPTESAQLLQGVVRGKRVLRLDFVPSTELAGQGISITTVRQRVGEIAEIVKVLPLSRPATEAAPGGLAFVLLLVTEAANEALSAAAAVAPETILSLAAASPVAAAPAGLEEPEFDDAGPVQSGYVRVRVERLDDAMEKLSALVVTRFRLTRALAELSAQGADVRSLSQIVAESGRQLRDLRAAIMRARMVSVSELLERVPLLVRGMSQTTGKPVRLQIDAEHAEVDKAVGERLFPAIVHLIRNAIDHAIESPQERLRLGKPEAGVITVTCFERSNNQLELSIQDDGRGIEREQVAEQAHVAVPQSNTELLEILTRPGFSTMKEATRTSGRGIGMDVVKQIAVDQLGGDLELSTEPGKGTTFLLRVPLTITIVDAFSFSCGQQTFVVPVSMVEEIIEIDPAKLRQGPASRTGQPPTRMFPRRGEVVPLISLDGLFALPATQGGRRKAFVVRRRGEPIAFEVDRVLGQQEVVVRPLEDSLVKVAGVTGSTDLGDGRPALVLDLVALAGQLGNHVKGVAA
jgi:two-component system chemotaxis sensor kinase CheA